MIVDTGALERELLSAKASGATAVIVRESTARSCFIEWLAARKILKGPSAISDNEALTIAGLVHEAMRREQHGHDDRARVQIGTVAVMAQAISYPAIHISFTFV